jgi:flagellar hook-basal body complex protein FliE
MRGYLLYKGRLHSGTYIAVSNSAILAKKYDWALEFIEKYKGEVIDENDTLDFYRFNLANYLFGLGRFSECLDILPETSLSTTYLLQGKCLELKAFYEVQSDLLPYKLDAFKMFLSRTSPKLLSEATRQNHVDFINLLSQIMNSVPGDKKRAEKLIERIKEKKQAVEWRWLMAKAEALRQV